jgi:hypothetical protein
MQEETARQITQDDIRRNHLSLFARISNITWDYSSGNSHDLVGGIRLFRAIGGGICY